MNDKMNDNEENKNEHKKEKAPNFSDPKNRFTPFKNGMPLGKLGGGQGPKKSSLGLWIVLFLFFMVTANFFNGNTPSSKDAPYSKLTQALENQQISKVTFFGTHVIAEMKTKEGENAENFKTKLPPIIDETLLHKLEAQGVEIVVTEDDSETWITILAGVLPWILVFGFFWWSSRSISKRMGGVGGRPPFMAEDKSRQVDPEKSKFTFKDIAGAEHSKQDLTEIVAFLKDPERFTQMGATLPRGVLMMGPPGTGKTLMAKAVAGEAGVPFFSMSGSEFIELYVGMGASRVRKLFEDAKKLSPSIIFIDEIDSIGRSRGTGVGGGHDEREQTLNQILAEMDGFGSEESVIVLAATNRPDVLDSALTRPGRFDRQVVMDLPTAKAREDILKIHTKKMPLSSEIDLKEIASTAPGFSGADLKNLANEAALMAAREEAKEITLHHFSLARDKVLMGNPREEILRDDQKKVIAVHESGHAIVAHLTKESSPLKKITIIPRGRALGFTEQLHTEDMVNHSKSYLIGQIDVLLGGRSAEEILIGEITTGAQDDLKRATKLCRKMIANWGMSDTFGPLSFDIGEEHAFLGREISKPKDFSEKTAERIDEEVFKLLKERKQHVMNLLTTNKELLENLSKGLLDKETLEQSDIQEILGDKVS